MRRQFAAPVLAGLLAAPGRQHRGPPLGPPGAAVFASLLLGPALEARRQSRRSSTRFRFTAGHIADDVSPTGAGVVGWDARGTGRWRRSLRSSPGGRLRVFRTRRARRSRRPARRAAGSKKQWQEGKERRPMSSNLV